tara:strand:+ start:1778 stop:2242 length:465 start_codon:yes stop_codon:yes gene_type:complete
MKFKKYIIIFILIANALILTTLNINNPTKISLYFLTTKTKELSLGKFITISFLVGYSLSSIFTLFIDENNKIISDDDTLKEIKEDLTNRSNDYLDNEEFNEKPPERDLRDSQPTISVNYRVVSQNSDSFKNRMPEHEQGNDSIKDEWGESESDW